MSIVSKNSQTGTGMIEMMVSLLVLAVGLLGILAMQAGGVKSNQRAQFSTEAYLMASDMAERIMAFDDIDTAADNAAYDDIDTNASLPANPNCIDTGCSRGNDGGQQKEYDTWEWGTNLASRLPNGKGRVSYDAATGIYLIEVLWDNEMTGATGMNCSGAANDMACLRLEVAL